jgi:lipopolysaccharide export system protein LptA
MIRPLQLASVAMRALLVGGLLALATPVLAQNPVEISADTFTISEADRQAVFEGNVVVTHPSVTVWAPRVTVVYGSGGTSDIESFEATGSVRLETADQTASGDRAVFDPSQSLLRLTGNVEVVNSGGTVRGPELVVNLDTGVSTFSSSGGGRVTGVFTAQ